MVSERYALKVMTWWLLYDTLRLVVRKGRPIRDAYSLYLTS